MPLLKLLLTISLLCTILFSASYQYNFGHHVAPRYIHTYVRMSIRTYTYCIRTCIATHTYIVPHTYVVTYKTINIRIHYISDDDKYCRIVHVSTIVLEIYTFGTSLLLWWLCKKLAILATYVVIMIQKVRSTTYVYAYISKCETEILTLVITVQIFYPVA